MLKSNKCKGCGLEADHDGFCTPTWEDDFYAEAAGSFYLPAPIRKSQIVDLLDIPDNVVFSPDAFPLTKVDVPLYLPNGTIGGKARIIEGDDEDAILIEVESSNPMITELFKGEIIGVSLVHRPPNDAFIKEV